VLARETAEGAATADPPTLAFRSVESGPWATPASLGAAPPLSVFDDEVRPGLDALGSLSFASAFAHLDETAEGASTQTADVVTTTAVYRRAIEGTGAVVKLTAEGRVHERGRPSQWAGAEVFFMHPDLRALRLQLTADGYTQPVAGSRQYRGTAGLMIEPVATLTTGLHLVSKLGAFAGAHSWLPGRGASFEGIDPDVYARYRATHERGLFVEAGLEAEPFANVVLYGNGRLTTNRSFSPLDQDHASVTLLARALFGRTYAEVQLRGAWFFVDSDRPDPFFHRTVYLSTFHTLWPDVLEHLEVGAWAAVHLDRGAPELGVHVAWEGSNGRRFRDHTPLEGEDYFFPQRGPGAESGRVRRDDGRSGP
jgi:hypothetical protein